MIELSGRHMSYLVRVGFNEREHRYFVLESEISGLNVEALTFDEFVTVTRDVAPDLLGEQVADSKVRFSLEVPLAA